MKILGLRNYSGGFRYAIIEGDSLNYTCINLNTENKVIIPTSICNDEIYVWYKKEITRIIDTHNINIVAIKRNENMRTTYSSIKNVMFFDCITTIVAKEKNINIMSYLYSQLKLNSKNVQEYAEISVGKTNKYWDSKIADAISAALKCVQDDIKNK